MECFHILDEKTVSVLSLHFAPSLHFVPTLQSAFCTDQFCFVKGGGTPAKVYSNLNIKRKH